MDGKHFLTEMEINLNHIYKGFEVQYVKDNRERYMEVLPVQYDGFIHYRITLGIGDGYGHYKQTGTNGFDDKKELVKYIKNKLKGVRNIFEHKYIYTSIEL